MTNSRASEEEKFQKVIDNPIKNFKKILDLKNMEEMSHSLENKVLDIFLAPPRLFPSIKWYALASKNNFWIPINTCGVDKHWYEIRFSNGSRLDDAPIDMGQGFLDDCSLEIDRDRNWATNLLPQDRLY